SAPVGIPPFDHAVIGGGDCNFCHKTPGITWTGGNFSHSPVPGSCISCHAAPVPPATQLLPLGATKNLFQHASSFNGKAECVLCHTKFLSIVGVNGAGGFFTPRAPSALAVASCFPCHQNKNPTGLVGKPPFDHSTIGTQDCPPCHKNPGISWIG